MRAYFSKAEDDQKMVSELWLRKIFPTVIFLNSNMPEKRYKIFKKKDKKMMNYLMIAQTNFTVIC